ncbi:DUF6543 domain-containing protein [Xanthomonas sp. WHRI 1810A]|uniref:dermonecrotic toxin domain-containing protein n=1 Tax=Xanthomonas sp. WHRI 1810A TaxID=3161565 RepID=UPI0032E86321
MTKETYASDSLLLKDFVASQEIEFGLPRNYAHEKANEFLLQHLDEDIDPDDLLLVTLYINEQDGEPQRANIVQSITLTDALMNNYQKSGNGDWWDHLGHPRRYQEGGYPVQISPTPLKPSDCYSYDAIYRKTSPQRFDRSTHISIDPETFKQFVWDADLQAHYEESLRQFWDGYGTDYNLLIKAAVLKAACVQHAEGSLSAEDKALVFQSMGLDADQPWETLSFKAFADAPLPHTITFRELVLYRYVATDIIVIRNEQTDRLVMYVPGNSSPLHGFKDLQALRLWVALQCKDSRRRKTLESHFKIEDDGDGLFISGVHTALAGLAVYPHFLNQATGYWDPSREIHLGDALSPWPFTHFKESLQARLVSDGQQLIRNRADHNKEVAAQFLNNAILATGVIAMVAPYLWVPLAAMSVALVGLGADEALEGRTLDEKKQGTDRIVFGVLNAVPVLAEGGAAAGDFLGAAAREGEALIPGAADDAGQVIASRSPEQQGVALARDQKVQAQSAEDALERANESAGERAARLRTEEQQRLAIKTHRAARYDSAIAFGVEPEGLRSLTPDLRTSLARFEYQAPLDPAGAWTTDDFGAVYKVSHPEAAKNSYFARVHSKIYCVERVEAAGQYRIVSPDDSFLKGPYVKRVKGFYSDIDLKTGLRGGDSFIEVPPPAEPVPEIAKAEIKLIRAQPPVHIEIPMDGIEVRPGTDDWGKPAQKYFAMNGPDGTPVRYDADLACWRKDAVELMWLDNNGTWRTGSEKAYLKVNSKLRVGVSTELYTFPRVPGFSGEQAAVDQTVHHIWLGNRLPKSQLIDNIKANMSMSPDLKFTFHIDIDDVAIADGLTPREQLEAQFADFPNMTISNLKDENFFKYFVTYQETAEPFRYFRNGRGQNLAAASDVLRYQLIREYGGIYMDCDDVIKRSFSGQELMAGPADVLVGAPLTSETMGFIGPGNSHFASHAGNPVLRVLQKELYIRFSGDFDTLDDLSTSRSETVGKFNPYMAKISEVTGPRLFIDALKKTRPDYADLVDENFKPKAGISSLPYAERLNQAYEFYAPFARRFKIDAGRDNSWVPHA